MRSNRTTHFRVLQQYRIWLPISNEESTNKLTPKACNNVKSNDLDANRLLFEHVKMEKNTNFTRSHKSLVSKDDDTSAGSDVFQLEELEQYTRDVVSTL